MQITLTKEQVKEAFGELRFMGADNCYQAWAELMKDIGKVKLTMQPQKKSLQKVWEWLEKYVAPSLKLFAEVGKIEKRDYIGNLVANGEMNITQKQLYDDYIKARRLEERG